MVERVKDEAKQKAIYSEVSADIDRWLPLHKDESFDLNLVCQQLCFASSEARMAAASKLNYLVDRGVLGKKNKIYTPIVKDVKFIDWQNASDEPVMDIHWPYGIEDDTHFGFDGAVEISPGDVIVNAGYSNAGKTAFAVNFLMANMDAYPCTLMGNEYTPAKFKQMVKRMSDWCKPETADGKPKFELIERHSAWKDIIRPDNINIIDWINLQDNFYQIGTLIEEIKVKLNKGIVLISLQKNGDKELGLGGGFSQHLASLYTTMDYYQGFNRLTVVKAKAYNGHNPNGEIYSYKIVNFGTKFHDIHKVKVCPKCRGNRGKSCTECNGSGYVRVEEAP